MGVEGLNGVGFGLGLTCNCIDGIVYMIGTVVLLTKGS